MGLLFKVVITLFGSDIDGLVVELEFCDGEAEFMWSDCRLDGWVCSLSKLPQWGFSDGRTARLRLMQISREILTIK
jgi:hypothetical protein